MNRDCEIVQDLLPLYIDGVCSRSAAELVEEHIRDCEICRAVFEKMRSDTSETILKEEQGRVLVRHEKRESQRFLRSLLAAIGAIYFPFICVWAYLNEVDLGFFSAPYWFSLILYFWVTLPYYLSLIELTRSVFCVFDGKKRTVGENVRNTVGTVLAVILLVIPHDHENRLLFASILAGMLILLWILSAIIYKRKLKLRSIIAEKSFWCCFAVLALICVSILAFGSVQWTQETKLETTSVTVHEYGSECEGISLRVDLERLRGWHLNSEVYVSNISVQWMNETSEDIQYGASYWIYQSVEDGQWNLFISGESSDSDVELYDLSANTSHTRNYRLDSSIYFENGKYKFVALINGKEVWFTFYVMTEMKEYG